MMGSRVNAYLNVDFYLNWLLTQRLELTTGLSMTHFSNGNTKFPNAGLNSIGMKLGLVYSFGRVDNPLSRPRARLLAEPFPRHLSYDLVLFGSRRCIISGTSSARACQWTACTTAAPTSTPKTIS